MGGGVWHCFYKHILPKDNAAPEDAVAHVAHVAHVATADQNSSHH